MATILIVEDEAGLGQALRMSLADEGHSTHWVGSAEDASAWLADRQADLALVDLRLPRRDGIDLLQEIAESYPDTVVVLMTAHGDVRAAVNAMKNGAADFLLKPVDLEAVSLIARRNIEHSRISRRWRHEQKAQSRESGLARILGNSPGVEKIKTLIRRVSLIASSSTGAPPNILIVGETGTGKDLIARAVHYEGPRRHAAFVHVNCGALPDSLAESELFGHIKGAFTDARSGKQGLFDLADEGTLFLDEVCSLPLAVQAKLLTAIESRRFRPVGAAEERECNIHLVSAMNRDPEKLIADSVLRADLYHRLRVLEIPVTALRERGEDVLLLAEHFVAAHCRTMRLPPRRLTDAARAAIRAHSWPGNVRELSHCMETAVLMGESDIGEEFIPRISRRAGDAGGEARDGVLCLDFAQGPIPLEDVERRLISHALQHSGYNVTQAASLLDVSRDTLRYRLEKYGINAARPRTLA